MRYVGRVRVSRRSLNICFVSIAMMESGVETCAVCTCVRDTCANAVLQQKRTIAIRVSHSLHCVFWSLDIERRSLIAARLKPTKTIPDTQAVKIRNLESPRSHQFALSCTEHKRGLEGLFRVARSIH